MFRRPRSPRPSLLAALGLPLAASALSGCAALGISDGSTQAAGSSGTAGSGSTAVDGEPEVVAAFYPLAWVAQEVAGDRAQVSNLTTPGGEPHDLELGVQQTVELSEADLVVFEKGFQPAVDASLAQDASSAALDVTEVVELEAYAEDHADEEHGDDHGDDHGDEGQDEEHAGEEHGHGDELGDLNPHFWQDPLEMATLAEAVRDRLTDLDPEGADTYAANTEEVVASLEQLDQAYADGLARCERDVVVVNHDAFGYLTRYGLDFEAITGFSPDAEPTAADLARLQRLISDEGITTVFYERLVSPQTARVLAADTGTRAAVLDPIEGLTDETADEDYLSLMQANLEALERANGC